MVKWALPMHHRCAALWKAVTRESACSLCNVIPIGLHRVRRARMSEHGNTKHETASSSRRGVRVEVSGGEQMHGPPAHHPRNSSSEGEGILSQVRVVLGKASATSGAQLQFSVGMRWGAEQRVGEGPAQQGGPTAGAAIQEGLGRCWDTGGAASLVPGCTCRFVIRGQLGLDVRCRGGTREDQQARQRPDERQINGRQGCWASAASHRQQCNMTATVTRPWQLHVAGLPACQNTAWPGVGQLPAVHPPVTGLCAWYSMVNSPLPCRGSPGHNVGGGEHQRRSIAMHFCWASHFRVPSRNTRVRAHRRSLLCSDRQACRSCPKSLARTQHAC